MINLTTEGTENYMENHGIFMKRPVAFVRLSACLMVIQVVEAFVKYYKF